MKKLYIVSRVYTPFFKALEENRFFHTGSPAYYNFIKYIDNHFLDFDYEIIFIGDRKTSTLFTQQFYKLEGLKNQVRLVRYKILFKEKSKFLKIEIVLNKILQYFYLYNQLDRKSIYYLDRENILLGLFLAFKDGLIVYRLLGITQNIYSILFTRTGIFSFLLKKSLLLRKSLIICTNDGSMAEKTKEKLMSSKFHLFFNGVDFSKKNRIIMNSNNEFIITYISRLEEGKGHIEFFILIETLLKEGFYNFKVNIIGSGSLEQTLKKYVSEIGIKEKIVFLGGLEHYKIEKVLEHSDIFVSINHFGIFGNNVLEATSKGLPIVALDNENVPNEYKKYFYTFHKNNLEEASKFIINLLVNKDLYEDYSNKSFLFYEKYILNWNQRIEKEIEIIEKEFNKIMSDKNI